MLARMNIDRDKAIVTKVAYGASLESVAKEHGITGTRVRQIFLRAAKEYGITIHGYDINRGMKRFCIGIDVLRPQVLSKIQYGEERECICKGNWRLIVNECKHLIGEHYEGDDYRDYVFFGIVHAEDDYYYGMYSDEQGGRLRLLSCVGSIEMFGFHRTINPTASAQSQPPTSGSKT